MKIWRFSMRQCFKIVDFLSFGLCVWKVIYTNDETNDIWLSSRRVIFREPLLASFRARWMIWQTADFF